MDGGDGGGAMDGMGTLSGSSDSGMEPGATDTADAGDSTLRAMGYTMGGSGETASDPADSTVAEGSFLELFSATDLVILFGVLVTLLLVVIFLLT